MGFLTVFEPLCSDYQNLFLIIPAFSGRQQPHSESRTRNADQGSRIRKFERGGACAPGLVVNSSRRLEFLQLVGDLCQVWVVAGPLSKTARDNAIQQDGPADIGEVLGVTLLGTVRTDGIAIVGDGVAPRRRFGDGAARIRVRRVGGCKRRVDRMAELVDDGRGKPGFGAPNEDPVARQGAKVTVIGRVVSLAVLVHHEHAKTGQPSAGFPLSWYCSFHLNLRGRLPHGSRHTSYLVCDVQCGPWRALMPADNKGPNFAIVKGYIVDDEVFRPEFILGDAPMVATLRHLIICPRH